LSDFSGSLIIVIKLKAKGCFCILDVLLFYIIQKFIPNENIRFFQDLVPYTTAGH